MASRLLLGYTPHPSGSKRCCIGTIRQGAIGLSSSRVQLGRLWVGKPTLVGCNASQAAGGPRYESYLEAYHTISRTL
jgi:hypothetical protein